MKQVFLAVVVVVVVVVGCKRGLEITERAPPDGGTAASSTTRPTASAPRASAHPSASASASTPAPPRIVAPLLVARLDGRRAAILLDREPPKPPEKKPAGATLLSRGPILTAGIELPEAARTAVARAAFATTYRLGSVRDAKAVCSGRLEQVADLARIVADDPTAPALTDAGPSALAEATFERGEHSVAAIVTLDAACAPGTLWAVPQGAPEPTALPTPKLDGVATKRIEASLAASHEPYRALPKGKGWSERFDVIGIGQDRAWVVAVHWMPGTPTQVCALVDVTTRPPKAIAAGSLCPESLEGATAFEGKPVMWFAQALARVEDTDLIVEYFPTSVTGTYGSP